MSTDQPGLFMLDDSLPTLVGVPIAKLEAKLMMALGGSPSLEQRNLWAMVLAIKEFKTELAGEKRV
jgi:hypothetical protein